MGRWRELCLFPLAFLTNIDDTRCTTLETLIFCVEGRIFVAKLFVRVLIQPVSYTHLTLPTIA